MNALLNIQIVDKAEEITFQTTYEEQIKQQWQNVACFSLDNFSEANMIEYALELIKRSTNILIVIESMNDEASPNQLLRLINHLVREKYTNMKLVLLGENAIVEIMGKALGEKFTFQPSKVQLMEIANLLFS